jgi:hypothetical protein
MLMKQQEIVLLILVMQLYSNTLRLMENAKNVQIILILMKQAKHAKLTPAQKTKF